MGKNKNNNTSQPGNQAEKAGKHLSDKKLKRHGKPRKAPEDHLKHIPHKLRELMKSKEEMKMGSSKKKKLKKAFISKSKQEGTDPEGIPVPHFKRKKKETVKAYLRRMDIETNHIQFLSENQIDRKPELKANQQETPAHKGKSEKKKEYDKDRLLRKQQKKLNRQEATVEKEIFVDDVPFGEVVMAPPCLSTKPKKAQVKPQKSSKDLLLNSLLGHTAALADKPSMARQRIMEEERERAVEAYRHLKKQKQQQLEARTAGLEKLKNLH